MNAAPQIPKGAEEKVQQRRHGNDGEDRRQERRRRRKTSMMRRERRSRPRKTRMSQNRPAKESRLAAAMATVIPEIERPGNRQNPPDEKEATKRESLETEMAREEPGDAKIPARRKTHRRKIRRRKGPDDDRRTKTTQTIRHAKMRWKETNLLRQNGQEGGAINQRRKHRRAPKKVQWK